MDNQTSRKYGWIPDLPDHRDRPFALPYSAAPLPDKVDLHAAFPPVYDQGQLGSCTANAIAGAFDFERKRQKLPFLNPSRLFVYFNERALEGTAGTDSGATLRDGMKTLVSDGVCPEAMWPYLPERFASQPPTGCYTAAKQSKALQYGSVQQDLLSMKSCLAAGYPFVFGFSVYPGMESASVARNGKVPMPAPGESPLGGHATVAVGYSEVSRRFLVRNSWGPSWGINGHFTLPYAYLADPNLAGDLWTIHLVA